MSINFYDSNFHLLNETEINRFFQGQSFDKIYKISEKHLDCFKDIKYPSQSFLENIDKRIKKYETNYNKTIVGAVAKLFSKIHNLFTVKEFKSSLELALKLKNEVSREIDSGKNFGVAPNSADKTNFVAAIDPSKGFAENLENLRKQIENIPEHLGADKSVKEFFTTQTAVRVQKINAEKSKEEKVRESGSDKKSMLAKLKRDIACIEICNDQLKKTTAFLKSLNLIDENLENAVIGEHSVKFAKADKLLKTLEANKAAILTEEEKSRCCQHLENLEKKGTNLERYLEEIKDFVSRELINYQGLKEVVNQLKTLCDKHEASLSKDQNKTNAGLKNLIDECETESALEKIKICEKLKNPRKYSSLMGLFVKFSKLKSNFLNSCNILLRKSPDVFVFREYPRREEPIYAMPQENYESYKKPDFSDFTFPEFKASSPHGSKGFYKNTFPEPQTTDDFFNSFFGSNFGFKTGEADFFEAFFGTTFGNTSSSSAKPSGSHPVFSEPGETPQTRIDKIAKIMEVEVVGVTPKERYADLLSKLKKWLIKNHPDKVIDPKEKEKATAKFQEIQALLNQLKEDSRFF